MSSPCPLRASRLGLLALALALSAISPSSAAASDWQLTNLNLPGTLYGLSCPTTSLCVAVGSEGLIATSTDPNGGAEAWKVVRLSPTGNLNANLRGVSCPTADLCVAIDYSGAIVTSVNPTGGAGAWIETPVAEANSLFAISCPSSALCVGVGLGGKLLTSTNPIAGASAWSLAKLPEPLGLHGVSCLAAPLCVVGETSGSHIVTSTNPTAGADAWNLATEAFFAGPSAMVGVACASTSLCLMGNAGNLAISTNPTAGISAWRVTPLATRFQVLAADCVSPSLCVVTTDDGEVAVSTDPTGGSAAWAETQIIPGNTTNGLYGLSCPSSSLCLAAGKFGQIIASTDPFGANADPAPAAVRPPQTRLFGRRHHVLHLKPGKRKAGIRFHFSATGPVSLYRCRLDRQRWKVCKTPKGYRLYPGRHVFRVRAIGPGGPDPTPALFRFRVLRARAQRSILGI